MIFFKFYRFLNFKKFNKRKKFKILIYIFRYIQISSKFA